MPGRPTAPADTEPATVDGGAVADEVTLDAACLPLERLEAEITSLAGHLAAATCRWLLMIAEFDRRRGWEAWETRSLAHWLSWQCGLSMRAAHEHVRVAHALVGLPQVRARFATGELSYSKVRAITRVATPETEDLFLSIARYGTTSILERAVRAYRRGRPLDDQNANDRHDRRWFRWWHDDDGMVCFEGRLPPEEAAVIMAAINAHTIAPTKRSAERSTDADGADLPQPGDDTQLARQADALVAVCETALAAGPHARTGAERTTVVVHADADTLATDADGACHIEGSSTISPETARRLACDATTYTIVEDHDGKPVLVDKAAKTVSTRLRRLLTARDDNCCRIPGCGAEGHLHAHHIIHRQHDGPNTLDNLILLCGFHHRLVHEGGYRVELDDGHVSVVRPGRTPLTERPTPPARGPDITTTNTNRGLGIEPHTIIGEWDGSTLTNNDLADAFAPFT